MANEFDQLKACKWRDIEFPVRHVEFSFQQDLVEHKYFGVDGARLEATGRGPINLTAVIPLSNGIVPGKNESWGVLYPDAFNTLLKACADRTVGIFQHPELGQITCRVHSVHTKHDGQQRDGVDLTVTFVETVIAGDDGAVAASKSPVAVAELAALDLDASSESLLALVPEAYQMPVTLNDFIDSLTAVSDQFSIQSTRALGRVDATLYHLGRLKSSVETARSSATWPVLDAIERAQSAVRWIQDHPPAGLPVLTYRVREDVSLAALVGEIPGARIGDLVKLNPGIMGQAVVPKDTVVRYHDRA